MIQTPKLVRLISQPLAVGGLVVLMLGIGACGERIPLEIDDVSIHSIRIDSTNVGIVVGPERTLLIDIGLEGAFDKLKPEMATQGIDADSITDLVVTHGHGDHAGDVNAIQADDITVWAHAGDVELMASATTDDEEIEIIGCEATVIAPFVLNDWPSSVPDKTFDHGISFEDLGVRVIPASGHSKGSVIVIVKNEVAFLGDLIRGGSLGGRINGSQPTVHYFHVDAEAAHRSLKGVLEDFPNVHTFWPGHGDSFTREQMLTFVEQL